MPINYQSQWVITDTTWYRSSLETRTLLTIEWIIYYGIPSWRLRLADQAVETSVVVMLPECLLPSLLRHRRPQWARGSEPLTMNKVGSTMLQRFHHRFISRSWYHWTLWLGGGIGVFYICKEDTFVGCKLNTAMLEYAYFFFLQICSASRLPDNDL